MSSDVKRVLEAKTAQLNLRIDCPTPKGITLAEEEDMEFQKIEDHIIQKYLVKDTRASYDSFSQRCKEESWRCS